MRAAQLKMRARILVVDDENGIRQSLRILLKEDHEVHLAEGAAAALRVLEHNPIDVIITDLRMPGKSGVDLLRHVKADYPDVEVIILTGYGELETAMKAVELGAFAYVVKPFNYEAMLEYVAKALEKRQETLHSKRLEQLALEANRFETVGRFVSGMLHDLGTPLSVIGSNIELALSKLPTSTRIEDRLAVMQEQVNHCTNIIRSTMAFLRSNSQERAPVNLNEIALTCLNIAAPMLKRTRVKVETELAPELLWPHGDSSLLRQAVLNLITNACQAMENQTDERELVIQTWNEDGHSCLAVSDTGPGIREEDADRIFETFYSTKGEAGTGLGLAVVKSVLQRHNGTIALGQDGERGAVFILRLPQQSNSPVR
jgi:signal transduction histidine kinase